MAQGNEDITLSEESISEKLSIKQELFCQNYVKNEEFRWNATTSYNTAYNIWLDEKDRTRQIDEEWKEIYWTSEYDKYYDYCSMAWSRLISNDKIQQRNVELWNEMLIDQKIDAKHAQIIFTAKPETALNAIKEYNNLKQRITKKIEMSWEIKVNSIKELPTEELLKQLEE